MVSGERESAHLRAFLTSINLRRVHQVALPSSESRRALASAATRTARAASAFPSPRAPRALLICPGSWPPPRLPSLPADPGTVRRCPPAG